MKKKWWKEGVIYQIYPRSFNDSNGDGIGDLRGIIEKLDYLQALGIDIIWLSPVYQSPNDDNGYDISDYYRIMDEFGTMEDFDQLLAGTHQRGLKLVMDLVINHTSDEHEWFQSSRKSKDSPERNFYIWRPAKKGKTPNQWQSFFSGSVWQWDQSTAEYYLHLFTKKQPDLNWENEQVRQAVYKMMHWWFEKGIDGFRMDVMPLISKREGLPDICYDSFNETVQKLYANGPRVHEFLQEMHREVFIHYDALSLGEGVGIPAEMANLYVGESRKEIDMIFHFDHMFIDHGEGGKFDIKPCELPKFKQVFNRWYEAISEEGWLAIYLDNHDFPRMVSRFANDKAYHQQAAKLLATLLFTLRGTPTIYQGSEIGMTNVAFECIEDYKDIETHNAYREVVAQGRDAEAFIQAVHKQGRDNARTPFQWNAQENAGFTIGTPWIKVNPAYLQINAASQENNRDSILNYYRKIIQFRKAEPTLVYGKYRSFLDEDKYIFAYERWDNKKHFVVVLNFSSENRTISIPVENIDRRKIVMSNYPNKSHQKNTMALSAWEARIYQL